MDLRMAKETTMLQEEFLHHCKCMLKLNLKENMQIMFQGKLIMLYRLKCQII